MQIYRPIGRYQLLEEEEALVHELEVSVVGPDVGVLDLLAQGVRLAVEPRGARCAAQLHAAHVVGARVEGRIDVDQVHLAPKAGAQQVRQDLLVVAVEQQAATLVSVRPARPVNLWTDAPSAPGLALKRSTSWPGKARTSRSGRLPTHDSIGLPLAAATLTSARVLPVFAVTSGTLF